MIDHERKFIHVAIPKTASISLTQGLGLKVKDEPAIYHNTLEHYISEDYSNNISYYKFSVVRNPWSRFASLWRDFTQIRLSQYSGWHKSDAPLLSEFECFEDLCLNFKDSLWSQNLFFKPQVYFLSYAGKIKMDYIGRFENLDNSFSKICEDLNIKRPTMIPTRATLPKQRPDKYYRSLYSEKSAQAIYDFYKLDVENFNYEF